MRRQTKKLTKNLKTLAAACLLSTALTGNAEAVVLTFDDIPNASLDSGGTIPIYKGFDFNFSLDYVPTGGPLIPFGAHSGDYTIYNTGQVHLDGVGIITEQNGADFTFDGLWTKVWGTSPESGGADTLFGTLEGYNNGTQVWSVDTGLNGSFKFFGAQVGLIDELRLGFSPSRLSNFLVDDISLNESITGPIDPTDPLPSAVPVPAALPLFGTGLAIMGFVGWRRKRLAAV